MARHKGHRRDFRGDRIPQHLVSAFDTSGELSGAIYGITRLAKKIAAFSGRDGMELMPFDEIESIAAYLRNLVDHWRPYLVCEHCVNRISPDPDCRCEGNGWLPLAKADATVRNRIIKMRMRKRSKGGKAWMKADITAKAKARGLI